MKKVSVVIPIYNSAKHLDVTFDSLMKQTMPAADFEIICVNDCSTDNTREVIENFGKKMTNVVLLNRTENSGGPSIPRNEAIDAACGEYLHFLDSDDFLGEEALERLHYAAKKYRSDVIFGKYVGVNGRVVPVSMFKKGNLAKADIIADDLVYSLAPHKMFNRSFLKEYGYKFHPEVVTGNEDQLFVMQAYLAAKVITVLSDYPYYFVVARGNENLTKKTVQPDLFFFVWHRIMEHINSFIQDEDYQRRIKAAILNRFLEEKRPRNYFLSDDSSHEQKKEWLGEIKKFVDAFMDDKLLKSLDPRFHCFWEAARENDVHKLANVKIAKGPKKYNNK